MVSYLTPESTSWIRANHPEVSRAKLLVSTKMNYPTGLLIWSPDHKEATTLNLDQLCKGQPRLLIIDSLRSYNPSLERTECSGEEMKHLNSLAWKYGVSILMIHHIRKPGENSVPALENEDTRLMLWLKQAAGHSAIINQSHTRIAAGAPDGRSSERNARAELVLRWHQRIKGEAGPLFLERACDDAGDALGYKRITDIRLLGNELQIAALKKLPAKFTFKDAKHAYERSDDPSRKWLQKCMALGLVQQVERGVYTRADADSAAMSG
jgi:hypothetical protein